MPADRRPPVIELVGAPGSGKTSVLPLVADAVAAAGRHPRTLPAAARTAAGRTRPGRLAAALPGPIAGAATWRVYLAWRTLLAATELARRPELLAHLWATQRHRPPAADARRRAAVPWFLRTLGARQLLTRAMGPGDVAIFDEGLVHRVVQLHTSPVERPDGPLVAAFLDVVPAPDLLIHVRADVDRCIERIERRGRWPRLAHRSSDELGRFVANAHEATESAVADARRRGWAVIDVDNGDDGAGPPDELAPHVVAGVRTALDAGADLGVVR